MPTLLLFILVFAVLVIAHEWGHFIVARLFHVEVDEFGLGLPPRFLTLWRTKGSLSIDNTVLQIPRNFQLPFDWYGGNHKNVIATYDDTETGPILRSIELAEQEPRKDVFSEPGPVSSAQAAYPSPLASSNTSTQAGGRGARELRGTVNGLHPGMAYTLNVLPIGGFVRPRGENDPNVPGGLAAASPWVRLGVLLAGPAMNILLGILIFTAMFVSAGVPNPRVVYLSAVSPNSPAQAAGFKVGDVILSVSGEHVDSIEELHDLIYSSRDKSVAVVVQRDGEKLALTVTPSSHRTAEEGAIGVVLTNPTQDATFLTALSLGFRATGVYIHELLTLPARIIQGQVPAGSARFVGLKGMYDFMNEAVQRDTESRATTPPPSTDGTPASAQPTNYTLTLIAILSLSLGVFNLLPIPALDGGRILFLLPELIFRRRVPPNIENAVHAAGMVTLLLLMLVINVMDFVNPVVTNLP